MVKRQRLSSAAVLQPPLTLYIHIPWCVQKCPYCDFNSHRAPTDDPSEEYVDALLADLDFELSQGGAARQLISIFIGGGTPSLFPAAAIHRLLDGVRERLHCVEDIEITLEANPGTLEAGRFAGYRAAGINRLSIGAQSLDAGMLQRLGRIHGPEEVSLAVAAARQAGFDNINLDLMFGLPGQTVAMALTDVDALLALQPEHVSYYQLTLEPNTPFAANPPALPTDDRLWEMQQAGQARLAVAGYAQYEISAYAQTGRRCRHNLNYWRFGDYLGIGAGAHGKLSDPLQRRVVRRWRQRGPEQYLDHAGTPQVLAGHKVLQAADLPLEFMMNALRLHDGVPAELFPAHTSLPLSVVQRQLDMARQRGLAQQDTARIAPTGRGLRFLNDLLEIFLQSDPG